ncbi:MAG: hypothetical protein ACOY0T_37090 [Myxococcota bacterium]
MLALLQPPVNFTFLLQRHPRVTAVSLLFTLLETSAVRPAFAQQDKKSVAAAHFARGVELANEGAYAEALIEFKRAYEQSPHYSVLYNIGQAYVGLGKPVQAVDALKRYLAEGGAQIALDRRRAVEAEIVKQFARTALVTVDVNVAGATVSVDGEIVGRSPLRDPVRLAIGTHRISARSDAGQQDERELTVAGEESHRVHLELPLPAPVAATPTTPTSSNGWAYVACPQTGVNVSVDGAELGATPLRAPIQLAAGNHEIVFRDAAHPNGERRAFTLVAGQSVRIDCGWSAPTAVSRSSKSTWGYVLGAVGIGLGGAAAAHFVWNLGRYNEWNDLYDSYGERPTASTRIAANELGASVERASIVTIALGVSAGIALGTGTVLLVTDSPSKPSTGGANTWLSWRGAF